MKTPETTPRPLKKSLPTRRDPPCRHPQSRTQPHFMVQTGVALTAEMGRQQQTASGFLQSLLKLIGGKGLRLQFATDNVAEPVEYFRVGDPHIKEFNSLNPATSSPSPPHAPAPCVRVIILAQADFIETMPQIQL
ncbi:MAG: hypothetical protein R3E95_06275 [Thiolinea sp.]